MDDHHRDSPGAEPGPERPEPIRQPAPTSWPGMSDAARARLAQANAEAEPAPEPAPAPAPAPLPWDAPIGAADSGDDPGAADGPDFPGQRHDAFTEARKAKFLRALMKCGCITEACRRAGVAPRTVYNHQQQDGAFLAHCATAKRMAATPVEITAWSRAVDGVEETVVVGGRAVTRTRHSEALLRMMLQGANPKKYGRNPGFTPKRLRAAERKELKRELKREILPKLQAEANALAKEVGMKLFREMRGQMLERWVAVTEQYHAGTDAPADDGATVSTSADWARLGAEFAATEFRDGDAPNAPNAPPDPA